MIEEYEQHGFVENTDRCMDICMHTFIFEKIQLVGVMNFQPLLAFYLPVPKWEFWKRAWTSLKAYTR